MASTAVRRASTASSRRPLRPSPGTALLPALAVYALFVLWPLLRLGIMAAERWRGYDAVGFAGLANLSAWWGQAIARLSLEHTVLWGLAALLPLTGLNLGLALLAARSRRGAPALAILFFPALLPPTVVAAIWTLVYSPLSGLLDSALAAVGLAAPDWLGDPRLALPALFVAWLWSAVGIGSAMLYAGRRAVDPVFLEVAAMEGAGAWQRFRLVLLPALRLPLILTALVNAALALQVFDLVFVSTGGGPGNATMLLPLDLYSRAFGGNVGQGAVEAMLQALLGLSLVILALLALRGAIWQGTGAGMEPGHRFPLALAPALLELVPLLWLLRATIEPGRAFTLGIGGATLNPATWDWGNFAAVWQAGLPGAAARSLFLALGAVLVTLLLAAPAAFALTRPLPATIRTVSLVLLALGLFLPVTASIIPLFSLLITLHLLGSLWGILLPEVARSLPFAVLLLWGFLSQASPEPLEAAALDGAGFGRQLVAIALPLAAPALATVAAWTFVSSWNEYLLPTVVSSNGSLQTIPTLLAGFVGSYDTAFGALAAGSLLAVLPSLLLYLLVRGPAARALPRVGGSW